MKNIYKTLILFVFGSFLYLICELIFRQRSHWTMFLLGGCCFLVCDCWNEFFSWDIPLWLQMLLSAISITFLELITGYVVNIILGWNIWDYSNLKIQFMGQISLLFSIAWYFLSGIGIILSDIIRWKLGEEKPHYRLF